MACSCTLSSTRVGSTTPVMVVPAMPPSSWPSSSTCCCDWLNACSMDVRLRDGCSASCEKHAATCALARSPPLPPPMPSHTTYTPRLARALSWLFFLLHPTLLFRPASMLRKIMSPVLSYDCASDRCRCSARCGCCGSGKRRQAKVWHAIGVTSAMT